MSNVSSNLEILFSKMENFVSSKSVVGEPIHFGDVIILPLVDVVFGVGAGGGETPEPKSGGNGGGLGAKITPSAVLVVANGNVQLVNVKNQDSLNKLIDMAPGVLSKLNLNFGKKKAEEAEVTAEDIVDAKASPDEEL